ncbi:MAG: hypothetical protein QXP52_03240 [Candidatus Aenigmatarchaeota archaeon]
MLELVKKTGPKVLVYNEDVEMLASVYVKEGVIPEEYLPDAYHIAFSSVYDIDILVSWNLEHIVKIKTKRLVSAINLKLGYKIIEICTPQEAV